MSVLAVCLFEPDTYIARMRLISVLITPVFHIFAVCVFQRGSVFPTQVEEEFRGGAGLPPPLP